MCLMEEHNMNRDNRNQIMIQIRQFLTLVNEESNLLSESLGAAAQVENEKLENLPPSLAGGEKGEQIEEAISQLQEAQDVLEEIQTLADLLPDIMDLQVKTAKKSENIGHDITGSGILPGPNEKRTERLLLVVTPTVAKAIRETASSLNQSVNEVVNKILIHSLCR